jgi:hypothetical protein
MMEFQRENGKLEERHTEAHSHIVFSKYPSIYTNPQPMYLQSTVFSSEHIKQAKNAHLHLSFFLSISAYSYAINKRGQISK